MVSTPNLFLLHIMWRNISSYITLEKEIQLLHFLKKSFLCLIRSVTKLDLLLIFLSKLHKNAGNSREG